MTRAAGLAGRLHLRTASAGQIKKKTEPGGEKENFYMKTTILIVAAAAMSAAALQAQTLSGMRLTADVPFAFHKGDTPMPAGRYVVKSMGTGSVALTNAKAHSSVITLFTGRSVTRADKGMLRFACYGSENNRCFLQEIRVPDSTEAMAIPRGKAEREFARNGNAHVAMVEARTSGVAGE